MRSDWVHDKFEDEDGQYTVPTRLARPRKLTQRQPDALPADHETIRMRATVTALVAKRECNAAHTLLQP